MEATTYKRDVSISLPDTDMALLKVISDRLGWIITSTSGSLDQALEDIEQSRLHTAKDASDLINQILVMRN